MGGSMNGFVALQPYVEFRARGSAFRVQGPGLCRITDYYVQRLH